MSKIDAGSKLQVMELVQRDVVNELFDLVESKLGTFGVSFDRNDSEEQHAPRKSDTSESELKTFLELETVKKYLPRINPESLNSWWGASGSKPNWDFISTCNVDGEKGILLVEAKSHYGEMEEKGKRIDMGFSGNAKEAAINSKLNKKTNLTYEELKELMRVLSDYRLLDDKILESCLNKAYNHRRIGDAISQAKEALSPFCRRIKISHDSYYQLSNRIAYTWKLASLGIPTVLLYLGFTNDPYWSSKQRGEPFKSDEAWLKEIKRYFAQVKALPLLGDDGVRMITLPNGTPMFFITGSLPAKK